MAPRKTTNTENKAPVEINTTENKTDDKVKNVTLKDVDLNQYITVRNGFQGRLFYKSSKTGEKFGWSKFGDEQEMELKELKNAKSRAKGFFANNWFMFNPEDAWVIDFLGLKAYYKNAVSIEDFDKMFEKSPEEITKTLSSLSTGQKKSAAYRARQLISSGDIDSNKAITAIEKALGIELIER